MSAQADEESVIFQPDSIESGSGTAITLEIADQAAAAEKKYLVQYSAPQPRKLDWVWPKVRPAEYVATGAMATVAVAGTLAFSPSEARWIHTNGFDDGIRGVLRAESAQGRAIADDASDVLQYALLAYPILINAGAITWAGHRNPEAAWQMIAISAESYALTAMLIVGSKSLFARERPNARGCADGSADPASPACHGGSRNESFFSGHTAAAFTGAGLICAEHLSMELFGNKTADTIACVSAMALATATGTLRVVADKHYALDVLTGAAIGAASGYLMPSLLHYRNLRLKPETYPGFYGLTLNGRF